MPSQALRDRFRERRNDRGSGEHFEKVLAPREHMEKMRKAARRRQAAQRELSAANLELGELFGELIENDWDLKAAAIECEISRQTAYNLERRARGQSPD